MEVTAESKFVRVSPRKVRLIVDSIKDLPLPLALQKLHLIKKSASSPIIRTIQSAVANATSNAKLANENLRIKTIEVGEGGAFKRFHPTSRGRVHPYKKRMSHIRVVLEEVSHGTKS